MRGTHALTRPVHSRMCSNVACSRYDTGPCHWCRCHTESAADRSIHHHRRHALSTGRVFRAGCSRPAQQLQLRACAAAPLPAPAGEPAGPALPAAAPPAAGVMSCHRHPFLPMLPKPRSLSSPDNWPSHPVPRTSHLTPMLITGLVVESNVVHIDLLHGKGCPVKQIPLPAAQTIRLLGLMLVFLGG